MNSRRTLLLCLCFGLCWMGSVLAQPSPVAAPAVVRPARSLHVESGAHPRVVVVPVHGTIDLGISALITRVLAEQTQASLIVLDINTLGGRVDAAIQVRDALLGSSVKTLAYVHPRAISAGALIALACDFIAVSDGASIGAATPIQLGEDGAKPVEEKMVSYFRAEMRTTAEAKGRRGEIAEAMVDARLIVPGVDDGEALLTLDTNSALAHGIADVRANHLEDALRALDLGHVPQQESPENWAERLVRFLTDPVVSGLLMSLGTLGILIELYHPGLGLPGALGALSLVLFFGGHLLVHLAGVEELLLFTVGLVLLAVEVFVLPGFGIAGILALVCIFSALVLSLTALPLSVALSTSAWTEPAMRVVFALLGTVVLLAVVARFLPRTRAGRRLVLGTQADRAAGFVAADESRWLDAVGTAESELRPAGVVRIGDARLDVVTEGEFIHRGTEVRVVMVEGARIVVRSVDS